MIVCIVIPTYNERENINRLLDSIEEEAKLISHTLKIVVVDGRSPDGTPMLVQERAQTNPNIHLVLEDKKLGLGNAYNLGMTYALKHLNADALVEMDADFQHDPKDLKGLIAKFEEGYDYVIGSRYIKGGSIPRQWALYRKLLSISSNLFSRLILGIFEIHDITSGFRISRASVLAKVDLDKLEKKAYTYKIQLLYAMKKAGARLAEIPIQFGLRGRGDSKMGTENITNSLKLVLMLRLKDSASFIKFLVVGLAGLATQTSTFFSMVLFMHIDPAIALLPSFVLSVFVTFTFNNLWSFKDRKIKEPSEKLKKFIIFVLINVGSYFIQRGFIGLAKVVFNNSIYHVLFIGFPLGVGFGLVWNYLFYSRIVWKKVSN